MQLLGGANVGLSMDLQEQVSDAKDQMQAMRAKLDGFVDAVGNEMRQVMQEHRNVSSREVAETVREVMMGVLEKDREWLHRPQGPRAPVEAAGRGAGQGAPGEDV